MSDSVPPSPSFEPVPFKVFGRVISTREDLGFLDFAINRITGIVSLIGVIVAVALPPKGLGFSTCTMIATLGVPCPGCGLTRSVTAIFHGDFLAAWQYNPFGYFFALGFALLAPVAVLPGRQITRLKEALRPQSYRIAVVLIAFTVGLMLHGITRAVLVGTHSTTYAWWWDGSQVPPAFQHLMEEE